LIARVAALEDEISVIKDDHEDLLSFRLKDLEVIEQLRRENTQRRDATAKHSNTIKVLQRRLKTLALKQFPLKRFFVHGNSRDERFFTSPKLLPPGWERLPSKSRHGEFTFKNSGTGERISEREVFGKMNGRCMALSHSENSTDLGIENKRPPENSTQKLGEQ
jgi:hypothetical protein